MSDIFFVLKTLLLSLVLVLLLQIRVGDNTLDESIHASIKNSQITKPLEEVAKGGVLWIKSVYSSIANKMSFKVKEEVERANAAGRREILPEIKRQSEKAVEKSKAAAQNFKDRFIESEKDYEFID